MTSLTLLTPSEDTVTLEWLHQRLIDSLRTPREPFAGAVLNFCAAFGECLFRASSRGSQLQSLGFFMREARLSQLRRHFKQSQASQALYSPRGVVFQIPPTNVPSLAAYSWLLSAITGNVTIVRLPTNLPTDLKTIVDLFNQTAQSFPGGDPTHTFILRYGHDDEVTALLSGLCDVRVIWGGDETVRHLRAFPLAPDAKEVTFPDRYSFAVISADGYFRLSPSKKVLLTQAIYRDAYLFDQAACSSPRLIVWIGNKDLSRRASSGFFQDLANFAATRYRCELGAVVAKKAFACAAVLDQGARSQTTYSNELTVVNLESLENFTRSHCGGGLFFQFFAESLSELESFVCRRDQTLTYFGFAAAELGDFVRRLAGRGIDRVVPIGEALSFDYLWDGYDLLQEFVRRTHIIPSAEIQEPTGAAA